MTDVHGSTLDRSIRVCVICCSTPSIPNDVICNVARALSPVAAVQSIVLAETLLNVPGVDVVGVPHGTKLSKIRRCRDLVNADLVCICDPDLTVDEVACRQVLDKAIAESRRGNDVIVFGIIEGRDDGTSLSRVIALDKWLSHRVIRPFLWNSGVGITLPGQFLVVSTPVLHALDPKLDSYLDDLYLGWIARLKGAKVYRVPVVVGKEASRTKWSSLFSQRLRWMKGLICLFRQLSPCPSAVGLLMIHYLAYHGLPILVLLSVALLSAFSLIAGIVAFSTLVLLLSWFSGQSIRTTALFVVTFAVLHCLVSLLWWIPANRSFLAKR